MQKVDSLKCNMQSAQDKLLGKAPVPPARSTFSITSIFLILNLVLFILAVIAYRRWPELDVLRWGSNLAPLTVTGDWWRLLTSMFLHVSAAHLLGNLLFLWIFGRQLERLWGKWVFLFFYLSCGIAGSLTALAYDPEHGMVGASPAIFGLAAGLIVTYLFRGFALSRTGWLKLVLLVLWTAYSIVPESTTAKLTVVTHIAGLATGLLIASLLSLDATKGRQGRLWLLPAVAAALLLGAVAVQHFRNYLVPLGTGMRALNGGRTDEAIWNLKSAQQLKPAASLLANTFLAEAHIQREEYSDGEAAARQALAADPKDEHAKYLLGVARLHRGYCNEAHQIGDELFVQSRGETYKRAAWYLSIARCDDTGSGDRFLAEGNPGLAIGLYRKALARNPDDYRAERGLARAYRAIGEPDEAKNADARADAIRQHASRGKTGDRRNVF
jgi:rhomboid protease GluP